MTYKSHARRRESGRDKKQLSLKTGPFDIERAVLLHNPGAGEGALSRNALVKLMKAAGFKCSYSSTKPLRWDNVETADIDFLVLAGGDGTVRKVAQELLGRTVLDKRLPIGLLPLGTANNIARTLELHENAEENVHGWKTGSIKQFDVGSIAGLGKPSFFLESFGYGLFPKLMHEMKVSGKDDLSDPGEKLEAALALLYELILSSPAKKCKLAIDEKDHSGNFLLLEVMNTRSIGPNLVLAPDADPGDGKFDVVLIPEARRSELAEYVRKKLDGKELQFDFLLINAQTLQVHWDGKHLHVDDEYHKLKKSVRIDIELRAGLLQFLLPRASTG
jgi:diacylglycerol kinase family enzyme